MGYKDQNHLGKFFKLYDVLLVPILVNQYLQIRNYQGRICSWTLWVTTHCSEWDYGIESCRVFSNRDFKGVSYRLLVSVGWFGWGVSVAGFQTTLDAVRKQRRSSNEVISINLISQGKARRRVSLEAVEKDTTRHFILPETGGVQCLVDGTATLSFRLVLLRFIPASE